MMSCWHLLWIIPLAIYFGLFVGALLAAGKEEER
jgi:hypothetical protein